MLLGETSKACHVDLHRNLGMSFLIEGGPLIHWFERRLLCVNWSVEICLENVVFVGLQHSFVLKFCCGMDFSYWELHVRREMRHMQRSRPHEYRSLQDQVVEFEWFLRARGSHWPITTDKCIVRLRCSSEEIHETCTASLVWGTILMYISKGNANENWCSCGWRMTEFSYQETNYESSGIKITCQDILRKNSSWIFCMIFK